MSDVPHCPNCGSDDTRSIGGFTVDAHCGACDTFFLQSHAEFQRACEELLETVREDAKPLFDAIHETFHPVFEDDSDE